MSFKLIEIGITDDKSPVAVMQTEELDAFNETQLREWFLPFVSGKEAEVVRRALDGIAEMGKKLAESPQTEVRHFQEIITEYENASSSTHAQSFKPNMVRGLTSEKKLDGVVDLAIANFAIPANLAAQMRSKRVEPHVG